MGGLTGSGASGGGGLFGMLDKILNPILGGMYGKTTVEKAPPVEEPQAMPTTPTQAMDDAYLASAKRAGKAKTIITGNLVPKTNKKTLLG